MDPEIEVEDEDNVDESLEGESSQETEAPEGAEVEASDEEDGVTITLGDDPEPEPSEEAAAPWVRELRKNQQKLIRELRDAKAENEKLKASSAPPAIVVGEKPTLASCEYDETKYEQALDAWKDRKRDAESQGKQQADAQAAAEKAWQDRLTAYGKAKAALPVKDFEEAEAAVLNDFDANQQNILLLAQQSEAMVYALGKSDKERARLAGIKNYAEFAIAIGRLEAKLKVTPSKRPPNPERRMSGSAPGKGIADAELKKLEDEASRTGDRTKVAAYHRRKMQAATA